MPINVSGIDNEVLRPFFAEICFFYDILIFSRSLEDHLLHLCKVLQVLQEHSLKENRKNCIFGQTHIEYLGHIVFESGVSADP